MKKVISLVLALVMIMALATTAFAATITINKSETVPVAGKTFVAYRVLEAEVIGTATKFTVPADLKSYYAAEFGISANAADFDYQVAQYIEKNYTSNSDALYALANEILAVAGADGSTVESYPATGATGATSVVIENVPAGYYLVVDTTDNDTNDDGKTDDGANPISAFMLRTVTDEIEINLKADKPSVDKNIDGANDTDPETTTVVKYNNTSFGDKVPYIVDTKVPDMEGYTQYTFYFTDTMSKGLSFNNDVTVKVGDVDLVACNATNCVDDNSDGEVDHVNCYTVASSGSATADAGTTVVITLNNFIQYKSNKGQDIVVKYSADVTTDAAVGVAGNPNAVTLTYSNDPTPVEQGQTPPTGTTTESKTYTYITEAGLLKVDPANTPLTGATFTLEGTRTNIVVVEKQEYVVDAENGTHWKLNDGTYTTTDPTTDGVDTSAYDSTTTKYSLQTTKVPQTVTNHTTTEVVVGEDGKVMFEGLGAGTYTITEIVAPSGYKLLTDDITLTIKWTAPATGSTECGWTYEWASDDNLVQDTNESTNVITVQNTTGTTLPTTGGMGTTLFYVFGAIMVMGAAVLLITKKRMTAE